MLKVHDDGKGKRQSVTVSHDDFSGVYGYGETYDEAFGEFMSELQKLIAKADEINKDNFIMVDYRGEPLSDN